MSDSTSNEPENDEPGRDDSHGVDPDVTAPTAGGPDGPGSGGSESAVLDGDGDEPALTEAGARLRAEARPLQPATVQLAVARRRARHRGRAAAALAVVVVVLGVTLGVTSGTSTKHEVATGAVATQDAHADRILASLGPQPIDPTHVRLVSTVQTFGGCDTLLNDLRTVGAQHVGSRGFGYYGLVGPMYASPASGSMRAAPGAPPAALSQAKTSDAIAGPTPEAQGTTLGTNVQVAGVDELDYVKAEGSLIYDLDGKGDLRITDANSLKVLSTLPITPDQAGVPGQGQQPDTYSQVSEMLVSQGHVVVFGSETDTSAPVPGDPSATRGTTEYLLAIFVDATNPDHPTITDRVKVEGSLVAARLVGGQIRLVTTSHMADIGFVLPTTPASIPVALERNRRSVATSTVDDWIPDWQRAGSAPQPLVPCDRVHVPTTFAGVAMTSMVTFPIGTGRFAPEATSILAPATTLYAGTDKVAISSQVWVDPIDQQRLKFPDWRTAIHEFTFTAQGPPTYVGSGIVDGSTVGQFAFGEVGKAIAVVTTKGTPWSQDPNSGVDLTLLTPDGKGGLATTAKIPDLSGGKGQVTAVRYLDGRVLIATGTLGQDVQVIDVSNPAAPRRAGSVTLPGPTGYFHPLPNQRALLVGSRTDSVPGPNGPITRPWAQAEVLDVANADAPKVVGTWEEPWSGDEVGQDHHAFTYWPERNLAMWGVRYEGTGTSQPNHAVVLDVSSGVQRVAWPAASKPAATPPPCAEVPITDPQLRRQLGADAVVLGCAATSQTEVDWPRYQCSSIPDSLVAQYAPDNTGKASYFLCNPAPQPAVSRVLVVNGRPILLTDQTLEALDPTTFASVAVAYHPTSRQYGSVMYG